MALLSWFPKRHDAALFLEVCPFCESQPQYLSVNISVGWFVRGKYNALTVEK